MTDLYEKKVLFDGTDGQGRVTAYEKLEEQADGTYAPPASKVVSPPVDTSTPLTGQITVTTGAQAVAGPDIALPNGALIEALSANGASTWVTNVGNNDAAVGDDITGLGWEMAAGKFIPVSVANLNELLFGGSGNGDKLCWIRL